MKLQHITLDLIWLLILVLPGLNDLLKTVTALQDDTMNPFTRIYKGDIPSRQYPFMVVFADKNQSGAHCGGALVDNKSIVTAAHCVKSFTNGNPSNEIILGAYNLEAQNNVKRDFTNCWIPEGYNGSITSVDDIAICRLAQPVKFTKNIKRICISKKYVKVKSVTLIGFGQLNGTEGGDRTHLQYASGKTMTNKNCGLDDLITERHICAKLYNEKGKMAEQAHGDSGGPLFTVSNKKYNLVGVVTYNYNFVKTGNQTNVPSWEYPGVYTRASSFISFIKKYATVDTNC